MNQTSVGSIEGIPFTACTSGPDIIILASNFSRVQQITTKANIKSIDCSTDAGKIAVSHDDTITIYEPIPLQQEQLLQQSHQTSHHHQPLQQNPKPQQYDSTKIDYKWVIAATIEAPSPILVLSFNLDGTRLLAAGHNLYSWSLENNDDASCKKQWQCNWEYKSASQISHLKFSPDGTLFCSASQHDKLVKIWFQRNKSFSFIYLAHPLPIIGFEWRRISKYTIKNSVANVLMTSCEDGISRIWVQDLYNYAQLYGNVSLQTQKHMTIQFHLAGVIESSSNIFSQKSANNNSNINNINNNSNNTNNINNNNTNINNNITPPFESRNDKQSQFIVHWINNKEIHITRSIESYLHETLLKILRLNQNSSTTSPLSPGESCSGSEIDTDTNEPDLEIGNDDTITAESSKKLRHKLCSKVNKQRALAASGRRTGKLDDNNSQRSLLGPNGQQNVVNNGRATPCSLADEFDRFVEQQLKKCQVSADVVFSLDKSDGSINLWQIKYLDGEENGSFRHVQIEKLSTLEPALPHYDATTMSLNIVAYSPSACLYVKQAYLAICNCSEGSHGTDQILGTLDLAEILSIQTDTTNLTKEASDGTLNYQSSNLENIEECVNACSISDSDPDIFFVTQHLSGILGLWKMNYDAGVPRIKSIELVTRITGLPIDPAWLQDGILSVEYNEKLGALYTQWVAHSASQNMVIVDTAANGTIHQGSSRPISPTNYGQITDKLYPLDFNTYQADPVGASHALPSVDEEKFGDNISNEQQMGDGDDDFDQRIRNNDHDLFNCDESQNYYKSHEQHDRNSTSNKDSFRVSEMAANVNLLPQYHVKQLIELLAFGKLQRVKAILNNVVNALLALESHHDGDVELTSHAPWSHRSRTLSIVGHNQRPSSINDSFDIDNPGSNIQQQVVEEVDLDYIEVTSIKPLPLFNLLEADSEKAKKENENVQSKINKREEFSMQDFESFFPQRSQVDETLDEILGRTTLDTLQRQKSLKRKKDAALDGSLTNFNPSKAKLLTRVLTHTHLPGLSNIDQMHLLAVADAVALFDASASDYEDMQEEDGGYGSHSDTGLSVVTTNIAIDSLDDRGLRFLTAMRQHVYLSRCLPIKQRAELQAQGIGNHNLVWAFHSETQDELVSLIPCVNRNKPQWAELREYGIGWWLKKIEVLRKLIEKVAQSAYQARQDPLDAALFYLAMKKKTLVCALLRRVNCDKRLLKLFEQDFNDPVNRKKALKNAYALLGLHRFEHAAAFFILAGSIWDAVEVCINNLNDIQLAIVLIRLHDTDSNVPPNLKRLLFTEILGSKQPADVSQQQQLDSISGLATTTPISNSSHFSPTRSSLLERRSSALGLTNGSHQNQQQAQYHYDLRRANPDPFLRSMAFWKLSDYLSSVHTLLENEARSTASNILHSQQSQSHQYQQHQQIFASNANSRRNSESVTSSNGGAGAHLSGDASIGSGGHLSPTRTTTHHNQQASGHLKSQNSLTCHSHFSISASVFNFYLFLKEQPLVIKHKQQLIEEAELRRRASPIEEEEVHSHRARSLSSGELTFDTEAITRAVRQSSTEFEVLNETINRQVDKYSDEAIARKERLLFFSTAYAYLKAGCPLLALEVLGKEDHLNVSNAQRMKFVACLHILMNELNTVSANNSHKHEQQQQAEKQDIAPRTQADAISVISSSTSMPNNNSTSQTGASTSATNTIFDTSQTSPTPVPNQNNINDNNYASSSEAASPFQNQFHQWLTKNIAAMQKICTYGGTLEAIIAKSCEGDAHEEQISFTTGNDIIDYSNNNNNNQDNKPLISQQQQHQSTDQIKLSDLDWVKHNEPLLRSMLTYCNLHSANENSLIIVRLELLNLLESCS